MKLTIEAGVLDQAVTRLEDAAATGNIGRSIPIPDTLTGAAETVRSYVQAVHIAGEVIADGATYAATSASEITLTFAHTDEMLARGAA